MVNNNGALFDVLAVMRDLEIIKHEIPAELVDELGVYVELMVDPEAEKLAYGMRNPHIDNKPWVLFSEPVSREDLVNGTLDVWDTLA